METDETMNVFIKHEWKSYPIPEHKKKEGILKFFQKKFNHYDISLNSKFNDEFYINAWFRDLSKAEGFENLRDLPSPKWYFDVQFNTMEDRTINITTVSWKPTKGQTPDDFINEVENYFIKLYKFLYCNEYKNKSYFSSRKIKISIESPLIGEVIIKIWRKRGEYYLLIISSTSDELFEDYETTLKILTKLRCRSAKRWFIKEFNKKAS